MTHTLTLAARVLVAAALTFVTHFAVFLVCWVFRDPLARLVDDAIWAVAGGQIPAAAGAGEWLGQLNATFSIALLLSSPLIIAFWLFVLSGRHTRRYRIVFTLVSGVLAGAGAACGYFLVFPLAVDFIGWGESAGLLRGEPLSDLLFRIVIGLALAFQIPPALVALGGAKPSQEHG